MSKESVQDSFVLPTDGTVADHPHRAYDIGVDEKTHEWLKQTPANACVPFIPFGNIPIETKGSLVRGDGPKAVLKIQGDTHAQLPRTIGIPKGKTLGSGSNEDIDLTFDAETISRREAIAQRIADFVCEQLLTLQGNGLHNFVNEGWRLAVPKELVSDIGFDSTFVPQLGRGIGNGWVPDSQSGGKRRRYSWLDSLSRLVRTRVKQFIIARLQIRKGTLATDTKQPIHSYNSRSKIICRSASDVLHLLCCVDSTCDRNDHFVVSISFSPSNLDWPVSQSVSTTTRWSVPPSEISWKQLEPAA